MPPIPISHDAKIWDWPLQSNDREVRINDGRYNFEVVLDASFFKPDEIDVQLCGAEVIIHCRHEKREDEAGTVAREVMRSYHLPADTDLSTLKSRFSRGHLVISAHKKHA